MTDAQMKIRAPNALKERLEAAARSGGRSLNSEVVLRLEKSFSSDDDHEDRLAALEKVLRTEIDDLRGELRYQGMRLYSLEMKP